MNLTTYRHLSSFTPNLPVLVAQRQTMAIQKPGSPTNATPTSTAHGASCALQQSFFCAATQSQSFRQVRVFTSMCDMCNLRYTIPSARFSRHFLPYYIPRVQLQEHQLQNSNGAKAAAFSSKGPSRFSRRQRLNTCSCKLGRSPNLNTPP